MSESHECPTCERAFDSKNGMKVHHVQAHDESISGVEKNCQFCGDSYRVAECREDISKYCSAECRVEGAVKVDKLEKTCEVCGSEFSCLPSEDYKTCSSECKGELMSEIQRERVSIDCEWCSDTFEIMEYRLGRARFCSRECFGEWKSEAWSGENSVHWKGGHEKYYGPNWYSQRERAIERDSHKCRDCGLCEDDHIELYDEGIHVHHITPIREFKTDQGVDYERANDLDNLITLCQRCHLDKWEKMAPLRPIAD